MNLLPVVPPSNFGPVLVENVAGLGDFYCFYSPPGQLLKYVQVQLFDGFTNHLKANPGIAFWMRTQFHFFLGVQVANKGNQNYTTLRDYANNRFLCVRLATYLAYALNNISANV